MAQFSCEGLKLLRRYKSISQETLSETLGIAQGTLSKIEKGLIQPNEDQVESFCRLLGVTKDFFFQPVEEFAPLAPLHRSKSALQVKVKDRIEAAGNLWRMHLIKLIDAFDYESGLTTIPLENISPEEVAQLTRRNLKLPNGPIKNLVSILEDIGIFIIKIDFGTPHIDGFTIVGDGHLPIVFLNSTSPNDRTRFTLAHELGHLIMHENIRSLDTVDDEANAFASAFLMPREEVIDDLKYLTLPKLLSLKLKWKVSMGALLTRAKTINAITENQSRYLWMQMSSKGYRTQEPSPLAPEKPTLVAEIFEKYQTELGYSDAELCTVLMISEEELSNIKAQAKDQKGRVLRFHISWRQ